MTEFCFSNLIQWISFSSNDCIDSISVCPPRNRSWNTNDRERVDTQRSENFLSNTHTFLKREKSFFSLIHRHSNTHIKLILSFLDNMLMTMRQWIKRPRIECDWFHRKYERIRMIYLYRNKLLCKVYQPGKISFLFTFISNFIS